jgi:hypothetical protein
MHANGVSADIMSRTLRIEPQSLEKIIAHIEGRKAKVLELENNPQVQALRRENAELMAKLAKFEGRVDDGSDNTGQGGNGPVDDGLDD